MNTKYYRERASLHGSFEFLLDSKFLPPSIVGTFQFPLFDDCVLFDWILELFMFVNSATQNHPCTSEQPFKPHQTKHHVSSARTKSFLNVQSKLSKTLEIYLEWGTFSVVHSNPYRGARQCGEINFLHRRATARHLNTTAAPHTLLGES